MNRSSSRLSDGRELIYYDAAAALHAPPADARVLPQPGAGAELRYDAMVDEWIVVASHRQERTFLPAANACPLCPSSAGSLTEIPAEHFEVVVFENRFPSLVSPVEGWTLPPGDFEVRAAAAGLCEVVVFSEEHAARFSTLPAARVRLIIDAWADRTAVLSSLGHVQLVFPFENCGADIGVTLSHPHGQIYAYPFIPPRMMSAIRAAQRYEDRVGRNLIEDVIEREIADGTRLVVTTAHWVAFVPFAARWPFQVQLHPRRHVADLSELTSDERDDLALVYLDLLGRIDRLFDVDTPYIAAWHQASTGSLRRFGRLYLDIFSSRRSPDKLKFLAGSEAAMGAFINDIAPEQAANRIRAAAHSHAP